MLFVYVDILGIVLKTAISYESILKPSRDFIYWSVKLPCNIEPLVKITKSFIHRDYIPAQTISFLAEDWIKHPATKRDVVLPLVTWSLQQADETIEPMRDVVVDWLPTSKEIIKDTLKTSILDALKSEGTK